MIVAPDGSDPRVLSTCVSNDQCREGPLAWSPDGHTVAFVDRYDRPTLHLFDPVGAGDVTIPLPPAAGSPYEFVWSPDGGQLAFLSGESGSALFLVDVRGLDVQPAGIRLPGDRGGDLAWLPSGAVPRPEDTSTASPTEVLVGTTWQLTAIDDEPVPQLRRPITVIFSVDRVSGFDGCNTYGGGYQVRDGTIDGRGIVCTIIKCEGEIMKRSEAMLDRLIGANIAIEGTTLTLSTDAGIATFTRLDLDIPDDPGAALDCAPDDRVPVAPHAKDILEPAPPSYISVNLSGIRRSELVQVSGSEDPAQPSTWNVVRDGQVIGVIEVPTLDGTACRDSGIEGV
jgi:heat shock protein HslJ